MGGANWQFAIGPIGLALGLWVALGSIADIWMRTGTRGIRGALSRLTRLPRADWGKYLAHSGLGMTIFAVAALIGWQSEDIRVVQIGESFDKGGYTLTLTAVDRIEGPNYVSTMGTIEASRNGAWWPF
jgi:cytochrome c-type biogenesis protein CcmF